MQNAPATCEWLRTGEQAFAAQLRALAAARQTIRLETYIYTASPIGEVVRAALMSARQRGVRVQVLVDAFGSMTLPDAFWDPLRSVGGEFRWFNPLTLPRLGFRDHRKLLVCDDRRAFIGGFNIAPEYTGDGVRAGWCDHGLEITGPVARDLAEAFDAMFARADFRHLPFTRLRKSAARGQVGSADCRLLLCGPGRGRNPFKSALQADLKGARDVKMATAYFLPSWRIRRQLARVVRRGGRAQILLGALSDVPLARLAAQSLYQRLLRNGVEIYEYQPQILHAKLMIVDDAVYAGSANLDTRSLHINYELMLRLTDRAAVSEARSLFAADLAHALPVDKITWPRSRSVWAKIKERWAYFLLARVDPFIARRQLRQVWR